MAEDQTSGIEIMPDTPVVRLAFSVIWNELRETIGSAPTAVLLHRAIAISRSTCPALDKIVIEKDERSYRYEVPNEVDLDIQTRNNFSYFIDNTISLLTDLTGKVLVNQLLANPLIRQLYSKGLR